MKSLSKSLKETLNNTGPHLYTLPLLPSVITFIFSLVASVILNTSSYATCGNNVKAFVIGMVVLGYTLTLFYGAVLVGPSFSRLKVFLGFSIWFLVMFGWTVYGTTAVSGANSSCQDSSLYAMAVALISVYYVLVAFAAVPAVLYLIYQLYQLYNKRAGGEASQRVPDGAGNDATIDQSASHHNEQPPKVEEEKEKEEEKKKEKEEVEELAEDEEIGDI